LATHHKKDNLSATYTEILMQAQAWQEALCVIDAQRNTLRDLWSSGNYARVLFTGCGSTHYLSLAAAATFQQLTGTPARGAPAGELIMHPDVAYPATERTLLVAISRSAETTETLRAVQTFRDSGGGKVVVVTNYGDRALAQMGTVTIAIPAGQEQSVAQTRSFASMHVATTAMAAVLADRDDLGQAMQRLPDIGTSLINKYEHLARSLGEDLDLDRFYFLGSGPRHGLASEASLKMKEMSLTHSEPFHFLEFRHGPKSMVGPSTLVIGLLSETNRAYEEAVLQEMAALGARILAVSEAPSQGMWKAEAVLSSRIPEAVRNVLYLPVLQWMAYYRARAKGLNPDQPHNLDAVVRLQ
jgi:glucosamine--fructose-6-phosphate aminotransferase (isomerizing)